MIKKQNNDRYIPSGTLSKVWLRDFYKPTYLPRDINNNLDNDQITYVQNEFKNLRYRLPRIDTEQLFFNNIIIINDLLDKENELLEFLKLNERNNKPWTVFMVNKALSKWKHNFGVDYYVVNNPYKESMQYLPLTHNYLPKCISSIRTYTDFIGNYIQRKGVVYSYMPGYSEANKPVYSKSLYCVDDYRNPICAILSLAAKWLTKNIILFCCDEVYNEKKEGSIEVEKGFYRFPAQQIAWEIISGCCYWHKEYKTKVFSCGGKLPFRNTEILEKL